MAKLPERFAAIEAKWGAWIIENEPARAQARLKKPKEELVEFYDDVRPRVEECLKYIGQFPIENLPADVKNLWWLVSSYVGVAVALEVYGSVQAIPGSYLLGDSRFIKTHNALDLLQ